MDTLNRLDAVNALSSGRTDDLAVTRPNRRAKIVATLGPSCSTPDVFRKLMQAGVDVARLNFSHGSHAQKAELIRMVRKVSAAERKAICARWPKAGTGRSAFWPICRVRRSVPANSRTTSRCIWWPGST